jgi:hypothetical protein
MNSSQEQLIRDLQAQLEGFLKDGGGGAMAIVIAAGVLIFLLWLIPNIFYLLTLQRAINRCAPECRFMPGGTVWLMLIVCCCLNQIWQFFVVINVSLSLGREFRRRGIPCVDKPGFAVGLTMAILQVVASILFYIPYVGLFVGLPIYIASLVLWIIYWVKVANYSKQLA